MGCCGSSAPATPDVAATTREGILAQANALPLQKQIDAAAQNGTSVTVNGQTYDFSGLGEADYQKAYADAMAQASLQIQKDYGADYIAQRQKELDAADPEGKAARDTLYQSILTDLNNPNQGTANAQQLQDSILGELNKGGTLDDRTAHDVTQSVLGNQVARGNFLGNAAQSQEQGALMDASSNLKAQREANALAFLQSGATPEDIQYRNAQQGLSNLSSFINGQSPLAQFGSLSGAQNQAVPFNTTGASTLGMQDQSGQAANYAQSIYGSQNSYAQNQANPWMAGIALGTKGASVAAQYGAFSPSKSSTPSNQGYDYSGGSAWSMA